ncbi:G1/S-specific cyclin [Blumeria hordei DH14]|uniref:G1/S-specific cyclin n=1 Tax=Blumeria graminis f. sp. hordei (strain DH14) TaxID=546991 RepID=N1JHD4_BLUG1|nr:G1/S-specific cyclin [Blumeria hordei DH14]
MSFGDRLELFYQKSQIQHDLHSSQTTLSAPDSVSRWSDSSYSASVWSDASSQSSDDSSISSDPPDTRLSPHGPIRTYTYGHGSLAPVDRSINRTTSRGEGNKHRQLKEESRTVQTDTGSYPTPVCQPDIKVNFVESLVDSSAHIVEAIWPLSTAPYRIGTGPKEILPLRTFIQETLRRSRTSYSTLQVTLYYLILIKPHVQNHHAALGRLVNDQPFRALQCGRRMFLSALILASKYLQDRNYSARAWSKISGLNVLEINNNEIDFLLAVKWKLHIPDATFQRWTEIVLNYTSMSRPFSGDVKSACSDTLHKWKSIITKLSPQLDNLEGAILALTPAQTHPCLTRSDYGRALRSVKRNSNPNNPCLTPSVMEPTVPSTLVNQIAPSYNVASKQTNYIQSLRDSAHTPLIGVSSCLLNKPSMNQYLSNTTETSLQMAIDKLSNTPMIPSVTDISTQESFSKKTALVRPANFSNESSQLKSSKLLSSSIPNNILQPNTEWYNLQTSRNQGGDNSDMPGNLSKRHNHELISPVGLNSMNSPRSISNLYPHKMWHQRDLVLPEFDSSLRCLPSRSNLRPNNGSNCKTINGEFSSAYFMGQSQKKRSINDLGPTVAVNNNYNSQDILEKNPVTCASVARKRVCCSVEASRSVLYNNHYPCHGRLGVPSIRERLLN